MKKLALLAIVLLGVFLAAGCIGGTTDTGQATSSEAQIDQQIDQQLNEIGNAPDLEIDRLLNP